MTIHRERLLVGIDERGLAEEAVLAAIFAARALGADVELVHGVPIPAGMSVGLDVGQASELHQLAMDRAREHVARRLADVEARAKVPAGFLAERLVVREGHPARVIVERARESAAALCFLGPHAPRALVDLGGTLRGVYAHAPCGVWLQPVAFTEVRRILVPTDLSQASAHALAQAVRLAERCQASVDVVHVHAQTVAGYAAPEPPIAWAPDAMGPPVASAARRDFEEQVARVDWRGVEHGARFVEGEPVAAILDLARGFQLVVMGTHGHTGLSGALLGNVTWSVVRRSPSATLALPLPSRGFLL